VDEIAEATSYTAFPAIEPAACFAEVGYWRQLAVDWTRGVPAGVERVAGFLRRVFVFEAGVDVTD